MSAANSAVAAQKDKDSKNDGLKSCFDSNLDSKVAACTQVIENTRESPKNRSEAYNARGVFYSNRGEHDTAIRDYDEAIRVDPKTLFAYSNRGRSYLEKGDYDQALRDLDEGIKRNPALANPFYWRAKVYENKGNQDRALEDYDKSIQINSNNALAFNNRGLIYEARNNYDRAINNFDEAIRINPTAAVTLNNRGRNYLYRGEYDLAIRDFEKAIVLSSNLVRAHIDLGRALHYKKELNKSIESLNEAVRLGPDWALAYRYRGDVYADKDEIDRAISDYNKALQIIPDFTQVYEARAIAFYLKGDYDNSIRDLDKAVSLDPTSSTAFNTRGFVYRQKGEFDRAITDLNEALRLTPRFATALSNRGDAYRQKGDLDKAIVDLTEALKLDPGITPAYTSRGLAYEQQGKLALARDDFSAAIARPRGISITAKKAIEVARERLASLSIKAGGAVQPSGRSDASLAVPADKSPRVALVIGNSNYLHTGKLANPVNDASIVAASLRKVGFTVIEHHDLPFQPMRRALRDFTDRLQSAGPDAVGFLYYAGHGVQVDGANYILPVNAEVTRESDVAIEAITASSIMSGLKEAGNRLNIVILDACRNNPFRSSFRSATRGLARVDAPTGSFVGFSTAPGDVAADGNTDNSPYAAALSLAIVEPGLKLEDVFKRVRQHVFTATDQRQVPWESSSVFGDFYFAGASNAAGSQSGLGLSDAASTWQGIAQTESIAVLDAFIVRFGDTAFGDLARARRAEVASSNGKRVALATAAPTLFVGKDGASWQTVEGTEREEIVAGISRSLSINVAKTATMSSRPLSFLPKAKLIQVVDADKRDDPASFYLVSDVSAARLDGTNGPIYSFAEKGPFTLNRDNVADYAQFFFRYVAGPYGPMTIVNEEKDIIWSNKPEDSVRQKVLANVRSTEIRDQGNGIFELISTILFKGGLFKTELKVATRQTELVDEKEKKKTPLAPGAIQITKHNVLVEGMPIAGYSAVAVKQN